MPSDELYSYRLKRHLFSVLLKFSDIFIDYKLLVPKGVFQTRPLLQGNFVSKIFVEFVEISID